VREVLIQAHAVTNRRPEAAVSQMERTVAVVASEFGASVLLSHALRTAAREAPGLQFDIRAVADHLAEQLPGVRLTWCWRRRRGWRQGTRASPCTASSSRACCEPGTHRPRCRLRRTSTLQRTT
jgi:hypothetical protein